MSGPTSNNPYKFKRTGRPLPAIPSSGSPPASETNVKDPATQEAGLSIVIQSRSTRQSQREAPLIREQLASIANSDAEATRTDASSTQESLTSTPLATPKGSPKKSRHPNQPKLERTPRGGAIDKLPLFDIVKRTREKEPPVPFNTTIDGSELLSNENSAGLNPLQNIERIQMPKKPPLKQPEWRKSIAVPAHQNLKPRELATQNPSQESMKTEQPLDLDELYAFLDHNSELRDNKAEK